MPKPDDPLLDFRLAYLRAVALAWKDKEFKKRLLNGEGKCAKPGGGTKPVEEKNIQELLHDECGLSSKWPHLAISVVDSKDDKSATRFEPELAAGWVGSNDVFEIELPIKPEESTDETCALAAYYQQFPHFMGGTTTTWEPPKIGPCGMLPLEIDLSGSLLEFGGVILRAIALYWKSSEFKEQLNDASKHGDAAPIISRWLGYSNPFNFFLRFKAPTDFTWDKENGWNLFNKHTVPIIRSRIVLNFPRAPEKEDLWPIALTSYNNTGPAYPFTC